MRNKKLLKKELFHQKKGKKYKANPKKVFFKNNAPFRSCITKINNTFADNAEDLAIFMPMYNLLEHFL